MTTLYEIHGSHIKKNLTSHENFKTILNLFLRFSSNAKNHFPSKKFPITYIILIFVQWNLSKVCNIKSFFSSILERFHSQKCSFNNRQGNDCYLTHKKYQRRSLKKSRSDLYSKSTTLHRIPLKRQSDGDKRWFYWL